MSSLPESGDASFDDDVLASKTPVLVDFWAPWCGPCRMLGPILEKVSEQYSGRMKVVKVNVDRNPGLKREFNVFKIPQMILFKDGKKVGHLLGAHGQPAIDKMVAPHVAATSNGDANETTVDDSANPLDSIVRPSGRR